MSDNPFAAPGADSAPMSGSAAHSFRDPSSAIIFGLGAAILVDVTAALGTLVTSEEGRTLAIGFGALGELFVLVVCATLWGVWSVRAATNARALSEHVFEFTPGSTIWWFFVPFANLVKPYQAVKEIDLASEPDSGPSGASIVGLWWGMWILSRIVSRIGSDVPSLGAAWFALDAAAALVAILMIRRINENQRKKQMEISRRAQAA
jgi:uncharacterized protein DUF4328